VGGVGKEKRAVPAILNVAFVVESFFSLDTAVYVGSTLAAQSALTHRPHSSITRVDHLGRYEELARESTAANRGLLGRNPFGCSPWPAGYRFRSGDRQDRQGMRPQSSDKVTQNACGVVLPFVQRKPCGRSRAAGDPSADQRRFAKAGRSGDERQPTVLPRAQALDQARARDQLGPDGRNVQLGLREPTRLHEGPSCFVTLTRSAGAMGAHLQAAAVPASIPQSRRTEFHSVPTACHGQALAAGGHV
jgi:hypothetical protein